MNLENSKRCIETLNTCTVRCDQCAAVYLNAEKPKTKGNYLTLNVQCAELCRIAAALLAQNSEYARDICKRCAKICLQCAKECGRFSDTHSQQCAEACYNCADQCDHMAATI